MLATLLKHSRHYIANRSRVNIPEFTAGRDEISSRFYEGAAAGTVMIGEAPRTEEFKRQFDWPDAVIHVPLDSPDIGRILADLNGDPERLRTARRNNAREAALRYDWLHRIRVVFDAPGLAPTRNGSTKSLSRHRSHDVDLPDRSAMIFEGDSDPGVFVIELKRRRDERGPLPDSGARINLLR
jgi:hypothetical protein